MLYICLVLKFIKMKKQILLIVSILILQFSCKRDENKEVIQQNNITHNTYSLKKTKLDSLFEAVGKGDKFMGSIALSYNGAIIYTNAIGFDDIETEKMSTIDSKYRIGSISKVFTASLVFIAIEENKLNLKQTIDNYFPRIENADKITIGNLLNHRSGIHSFTNDQAFISYHTQYKTPEEMVEIISNYNSDFEPDTEANYSNSNYVLLSIILEKIYDSNLKDIIAEKLTAPLTLRNTYYGGKISLENKECNSYKFLTTWTKQVETDMSVPMGAGAIVSTPSDLTMFMEALFSGEIISKKSLDLMTTIKDNYGMGISRFTISDRQSFGHSGSIDGFTSLALYFSKEKLGVAITSNGDIDSKNEILSEALSYYFNDVFVEVSKADLKKYAGVYTAIDDKSNVFSFSQNKNSLILEVGEDMRETLLYKGQHKFLFEQIYAESFSFVFLPESKELWVRQGDYEGLYKKE